MFFAFIYRHRAAVLTVASVIVIASAAGLTRLQVSTDNRIFYGPNNPYYKDYLAFESEFAGNESILFVIAAPHTISEEPYPEAIRWLSDQAGGLEHVTRVDSLANYPHPSASSNEISVQSLLDWACPVDGDCRPGLSKELADPHLVNRFVNPDQTATGVLATVSIERGSVGEIEHLKQQSQRLAEEFRGRYPDFEILFTGGVPMMAAFAEATAADLALLLPAALLTISLLLALVLGSIRLAAAILLVGVLSILVTLGIAGWLGHVINNATSIVPVIVFTLVVTSSMHIAVHFSRNIRSTHEAFGARDQSQASLSSSFIPILLSAVTSVFSLCSLWFVDSPPLRALGLMSAAGVAVGALLTVTVLPVLLASIRTTSETQLNRIVQKAVNGYARRLELGRSYAGPSILVILVCIGGLSFISVNEDFVRFFDESVPFRIQTDRATEILAGPNHIEVVVTNTGGSVFDPAYLQYTARLTSQLRTFPSVANAHSFADVMDEVSVAFSSKSIDDVIAGDELAQLFLIYELSLQQGQSNTDLVNAAQDASRISVLLKETTSSEIEELEHAIYDLHDTSGAPYSVLVTGENIPVAHLSWMNIRSMVIGIFLSLAFTATVIGLTFRSAKLGVAALLATVVPVLAGFGLWGWINGEIGLAATAVIALTIGVVVDDAAHYIYRFLDARSRLELEPWPSAAYACHRTGAAIISTSIVMGLGLALLLLSSFAVNSSFGAVACLIIGSALAFNLAVLPRVTVWAATSRSKAMESAVEHS